MDFQELTKSFIQLYGEGDTIHTFFAPGRVNLIGEHIDYNGGFVFPGALTMGIAALARRRSDGIIRLNSQNADQEVIVDTAKKIVFDKADDWGNYPKGVFAFLVEEGQTLAGYDILYSGNVPDGAGLSSSAAIEVLTTYMMLSLGGQMSIDKVWIARFCQRVENKFIGVNSGIMDQFCVAMGIKRPSHSSQHRQPGLPVRSLSTGRLQPGNYEHQQAPGVGRFEVQRTPLGM